ncbi:MAG TPA: M1 family aminopeptidase, partial [Candidatus Cloacimonadota bacterium]|nr:M1 family aminopeptidase [Candidatus Cloacimonadota bacterium]
MKVKLIWIFLLLLALSSLSAGRIWERPQRKTTTGIPNADFYRWANARADSAHGFDVQKYVIDININTQYISGNVLATVEATELLPFISYELVGLSVSSVQVNGVISTFTHTAGIIQIPVNASPGQIFTTQVYYSGNPQLSANLYGIGMHFSTNSVFTISDPDAGRQWWPCYDHPWDKAVVDLHVTMRSDWKVAANGLRDSITDNGNGTATTVWLGEHPMTTYLVCITAGPYVEIPQTALNGDLPILNFVTQAQYNNALIDFSTLPAIIDYFSQIFGTYPFEKYGHATVNMGTYGAMEHQTMTTLGSYIITGNHTHEITIAHELAHQWYGNAVSFLDFKDVWLSEGFATYSEHLWTDKVMGWQSACAYVLSSYHQYYTSWENSNGAATIYDPSFYDYFSPPSYEKAASVLHMLRLKIGNASFFQLLSQWFETYKYGNAISSEFQAMAESVSGMELDQFFQQWIYGSGIPSVQYSVLHKSQPAPMLKILARSTSPTATSFELEIPFLITHAAGADSLLITATPAGQENVFPGIAVPESLSANHNNWTLLRGITPVLPQITECLATNASILLAWPEFGWAGDYQYQIFRKTPAEQTWQLLTPQALSGTSYTDTDVQNGIAYQYILKVVDADGYASMASEIATATPVNFSFANYL